MGQRRFSLEQRIREAWAESTPFGEVHESGAWVNRLAVDTRVREQELFGLTEEQALLAAYLWFGRVITRTIAANNEVCKGCDYPLVTYEGGLRCRQCGIWWPWRCFDVG